MNLEGIPQLLTEEQTACMLYSLQEQEDSANVVTGMLQVFEFTIYDLLDPETSLSFITPYIAIKFCCYS